MAGVCREFGISRKTGYKIFQRYKDEGLSGLEDRPRSPYRHPNKLPFQIESAILRLKREHRSWGAPKLRDKLIKDYPMIRVPAVSTIHATLDPATAWSSDAGAGATRRRAPRSASRARSMRCGARTTRASFASATAATAIR